MIASDFARPYHGFLAGCLLVVLLVAPGCDRADAGKTVREDANSAEDVASNGHQDDAPAQPQGVGQACEGAETCPSYLACMDQTCQIPPAITGEHDESTPRAIFLDEDGEEVAQFYLELAVTEQEQRKGLMFRREMLDDWGMLFIYEAEGERNFWMENTFISLDMLFVADSGELVHVLEEAEPLTKERRNSRKPARYVLEINGGLAQSIGLRKGQTMRLENVDRRHHPGQ